MILTQRDSIHRTREVSNFKPIQDATKITIFDTIAATTTSTTITSTTSTTTTETTTTMAPVETFADYGTPQNY